MKHTKTTFVFTPEFGARMRQLRERRKLSLREMASLMDRHQPGSFNLLAKLERGALRHPSINLIADFLRACGSGFEDLLDLLKPYTSQPPVMKQKGDARVAELLKSLPEAEQRAMLAWERATTERQEARAASRSFSFSPSPTRSGKGEGLPRVETDRQRVFRIVWSFIHANWNEVFEQKLFETMLALKNEVPRSRRKSACGHARRFFGILTRFYRHEARRQGALARVERRAREDGLSDKVVAALLKVATAAHAELAQSGRLDWQPTQEEIIKRAGRAPKVEKAETRLEMAEVDPLSAQNEAYGLVRAMVVQAVVARLEELRLAHVGGRDRYINWIDTLLPVALEHGVESPEWKAKVSADAAKSQNPPLTRQVAAIVASTFDRWKVKLPPKADGVRRPE